MNEGMRPPVVVTSAVLLVVSTCAFACACAKQGPDRTSAAPSAAPAAPPQAAAPRAQPLASPEMRAGLAAVTTEAPAASTPPPVSAPPPPPPYDLESDRARRAGAARDELGAKTRSTVVSDIFVVLGPSGWQGAAFDQSVALMNNAMAGYLNGRFAKKPSRAISVYLFPNGATYEAFCKKKYDAPCIAHYGFYSPSDRYMVMNAGLGLGTLTHEIVHPLVEADFPGAPTWINEGIASLFEGPVIPKPGEIHGVKNWRHPRLVRALKSAREKDAARLDALFGMADDTFRDDDEDLHYAMARFACQWLDERGKLWAFYQRWRDHASEDPTGAKSFEEVVGKSPADASAAWTKWVLAL
jgi:hypothetical protein